MHGGYILYYAVAVWLLMRYIKGVLTLQEGSVGFAVGGQLLLMIIGLIAGVVITVIYGSIVDIGIYLKFQIFQVFLLPLLPFYQFLLDLPFELLGLVLCFRKQLVCLAN